MRSIIELLLVYIWQLHKKIPAFPFIDYFMKKGFQDSRVQVFISEILTVFPFTGILEPLIP